MSLTTTTLASAMASTDPSMVVTSATGFAAGGKVLVDQEVFQILNSYVSGTTIPVLRGQNGTIVQAHAVTANVTTGTSADFANAAPQLEVTYPIAGRARTLTSYGAAGAISLPAPGSDAVAVINGTSALAMTLANPTKDMDGSILWIASNGKAAHTVTYTAGFGNAGSGYTVATFTTGAQQTLSLMAINGIWQQQGTLFSGTLTAILIALA